MLSSPLATAVTATSAPVAAGALAHPTRRRMLGLCAGGIAVALAKPAIARSTAETRSAYEWELFRSRFVLPDGRVVDAANRGISHSEGQGIAMLAAADVNDRATFNCLHEWTRSTLKRDEDALHAWRYRPGAAKPVDDPNNATDGDLLIAYALVTGANRWGDEMLRAEGQAVARDILRHATRETSIGLVLLPGAVGFAEAGQVTVNPSYYVFPALRQLAAEVPDAAWGRLWESGQVLLRDDRFGRWKLPPDWLDLSTPSEPAKPAGSWPARFSFDAVRAPLYLTWAGLGAHPAVAAAARFWAEHPDGAEPAWTDLSDDSLAPYAQPVGMVAIRRYVSAVSNGRIPVLPSVAAASDYYAAALTMLTHLALDRSMLTS